MTGRPMAAPLVAVAVLGLTACHGGPWATQSTDPSAGTDTTSASELPLDTDDYRGPKVLSVWPERGATNVPRDVVLRIRFDGQLDGATVTPRRFTLASGPNGRWITTSYDPVRQELRLWSSPALTRKVEWVLELEGGLWGLDGEEVLPEELTRFRTGDFELGEPAIPRPSYEDDIAPVLGRACTSCHGGDGAVAGLRLDSPQGLAETAILAGSSFGTRWKRIEPQRPDLSYLIYKIIGWEGIAGQRMPSSFGSQPPAALSATEQQLLSDWIAVGLPFVDQDETDS